jgi:hypothetical protein
VVDNDLGQGSGFSLKNTFRLDTWRGRAGALSALLFVITPSLAFFVSVGYLLLLVPAAALSFVGLRDVHDLGEAQSPIARSGFVMVVNGTLLVAALFAAGFIEDFVLTEEPELNSRTMALGLTTVHVLLGLGLLLVDQYRHARRE